MAFAIGPGFGAGCLDVPGQWASISPEERYYLSGLLFQKDQLAGFSGVKRSVGAGCHTVIGNVPVQRIHWTSQRVSHLSRHTSSDPQRMAQSYRQSLSWVAQSIAEAGGHSANRAPATMAAVMHHVTTRRGAAELLA